MPGSVVAVTGSILDVTQLSGYESDITETTTPWVTIPTGVVVSSIAVRYDKDASGRGGSAVTRR